MTRPGVDLDDDLLARAAWSRLVEPGDTSAGGLITALGAGPALRWAHAAQGSSEAVDRSLTALDEAVGPLSEAARRRLTTALARWGPRLSGLDPHREVRVLRRLGGFVLHPGAPGWPTGLDDLGPAAPPCLWVRGETQLASALQRSVALVGARASTSYGEHVTVDLAAGLAGRGVTVVSGGAYGIDAAAHRGALAAGGLTVVLLAGGVDRPYPAGNADLLQRVLERGGSVVSEVPPGSVPSRSRFLQRNRLIAAAANGTVVVEAAWRSGAINTATHANALLRPVGAVPGPVTSMASAGCHRLLRDGAAVCVTDVDEVLDLVGTIGDDLSPVHGGAPSEVDPLDAVGRKLLDALPVRSGAPVESLARSAGLSEAEVRGALGGLEVLGLAVRDARGWRCAARTVARR